MKNFSLVALFASYLVILCFVFYYPKFNKQGSEATISYDVAGYYFYLPAIFIYHDIHHLEFQEALKNKYRYSNSDYQGVLLPDSTYTMKYPIGAAIFYSPFFFIAHGYASATGLNADGFSHPYQVMLSLGCLFYTFLGLWFLRKILLLFFSEMATGITLLLLVTASNYLNYSAIDHAMTHNQLFTLYVFIIWFSIKFHEKPTLKIALLLGLFCGLATITRPTEIICVLIPVLWNVTGYKSLISRIRFFFTQYKMTLLFIFGAIIVGSIQLFYWKITTGKFLFYSYEEQTFSWLHPHIIEGLFSYKKGWFIYTPVMLFIIPGFIYLYKNNNGLFLPIFLFVILNIYIAFSWDIWWYGGSLGQRSMVQSYAFLSLPIAALVQAVLNSHRITQFLIAIICGFFIWFNITLTFQAHNKYSILDDNAMNRVYFWKVFGKLKIDLDDKKYLDTYEIHKGERSNVKEIYFNDIEYDLTEIDTTGILDGKKCLFVTAEKQFTQPYAIPIPSTDVEWINISADFYFPIKEWDIWKMPQFIVQFKNNGEVVKVKFLRVHRIMGSSEKKNLNFDVKIPLKEYDLLEFYLWNADGTTTTYIDNIRAMSFN